MDRFAQTAAKIVDTAHGFYERGWLLGTSGNLSAVVNSDPLRVAMTASGLDKGALVPESILLIDERGEVVSENKAKPSDEGPLHLRIVKDRNAGAVLHTHSVWSTMLSDMHFERGGLAIEGYEMLKGLQGVKTHEHREWLPILDNSQNLDGLAGVVADMLSQHPEAHGFLLRRHGLYTWGADLMQAKRHVEILEFLLETVCRMELRG
jgi:methylthioribulose-1-phosphate dehydratase